MLSKKETELLDALEPRAASEGVEIVTVAGRGREEGARPFACYIDTPEGVSFDELSGAQVWINDIMDELDPFPGAYTLEVSSPGIDRPLRTLAAFRAVRRSETAVIQTVEPRGGRSKWTGTIVCGRICGNAVMLDVDGVRREDPDDRAPSSEPALRAWWTSAPSRGYLEKGTKHRGKF